MLAGRFLADERRFHLAVAQSRRRPDNQHDNQSNNGRSDQVSVQRHCRWLILANLLWQRCGTIVPNSLDDSSRRLTTRMAASQMDTETLRRQVSSLVLTANYCTKYTSLIHYMRLPNNCSFLFLFYWVYKFKKIIKKNNVGAGFLIRTYSLSLQNQYCFSNHWWSPGSALSIN